MKKTLISLGLASLILAGCSGGGSTTADNTTAGTTGSAGTSAKPSSITITYIGKSKSNPVFPVGEKGAEAAAADLTKTEGVTIKIDDQTPTDENGQEQAQRIEQAVQNGTNGILISCSDASKVNKAIDDAVAHNVPVMTFDSDAPDSKRFAYYGADDKDCGTEVMDELGKVLNGKGTIAILAGNQNAPNLQKRVTAVKAEAAKFPGIKIKLVANHLETPQDASAKVLEVMSANPDITGWAMVGGWPLFAKQLLTSLDPSKVKIVSVDALPAELYYVDKGLAPVLLAQPIYYWGSKTVPILVDKILHKKDPAMPINKMDLIRVTKDSLGTWAKQLQDWGVPDVDPKFLAAK